jgi:hypothetical protein
MKGKENYGVKYKMVKATRTAAMGRHYGVKKSTIYFVKNNGGKIRKRVTLAISGMPTFLV